MSKKIAVKDNIKFSNKREICKFFGKNSCSIFKGFFPMEHDGTLPDEYMLWCPKMAKNINEPFDENSEWINILDEPDLGQIYERNINQEKNIITEEDQMDKLRICFMLQRIPNNQMAYMFRGVYKYLKQNTDGARIYQKISNEININPFINYYSN